MATHYIVTPVLNAEQTIDATIWSIVSQIGNVDIHYHVQDGCSTDGTIEKIQRWSNRIEKSSELLPGRVKFTFVSEPDLGIYDAISKGFARMAIPSDAFMGWCNADDTLWPGALDAVARLAHDLPNIDWIMGWPAEFDEFNRFTLIVRSPAYPQAILAAGLADGINFPFVQQESTFWRKRLWDKAGGLNCTLRLAGDWDLWMRFAQHASLTHIHRQMGAFHVRPGQQSSDKKAYRSELDRILPQNVRLSELRDKSRRGMPLTTIARAAEGETMCWHLSSRKCSVSAAVIARAIETLPPVSSLAIRLFHELW